jgi:D-proline reductase (dithiol) PrdB
VGLIQRGLDEAGLCTLSITQNMEITALVKPSRALYVGHPFGLTFGPIGDRETQRRVLEAMLDAATTMTHRGIRDSGFAWEHDDLRDRQLRKLGR